MRCRAVISVAIFALKGSCVCVKNSVLCHLGLLPNVQKIEHVSDTMVEYNGLI